MILRVEKQLTVREPIDDVWAVWSDPQKIASCVPGVFVTDQLDENRYRSTIVVKMGPAVTTYHGELQVEYLDAIDRHIEIAGEGRSENGRAGGSMKMSGKLSKLATTGTEVAIQCTISLDGFFAQLGTRALGQGSNIVFREFVKSFHARLLHPSLAPESNMLDLSAMVWEVAAEWFRPATV